MKISSVASLLAGLLCAQAAFAGNWTPVNSPNVGNTPNSLNAVGGASDNDVWAVGVSSASGYTSSRALIEHWNGTRWSIVRSISPGASFNILAAVAAVSANDVWAIGESSSSSGSYQTLIEHWNGTAWSVVSSPNASATLNFLSGIAVVSANDIWAVGSFQNGDDGVPLTLHWNGAAWSIVSSPTIANIDTSLSGVAAIAANDVWAVGAFGDVNHEARTFTVHWNGTAWSIVPSANDGVEGNSLHAVTAIASDDVWAVGRVENVDTLALHWDGASWSVVSTPTIPDNGFATLDSVVALSSDSVWAVGQFFQNSLSRSRTLTELWNGSSWSIVSSPNRGNSHNYLKGVGAMPGGTLWAVGARYNNQFIERTLILQKLPSEGRPEEQTRGAN